MMGSKAVEHSFQTAAHQKVVLFLPTSLTFFSPLPTLPSSNNGHMIKFEMFETDNAYQCHFAQIGTFVVSIAHYMRAHFNYQALEQGRDFSLPSDAGYLNCIQLQGETETSIPLYAKIGCMERETFTSTKLQLHVYTDDQCSVAYNDGQTARYHANRGYLLTDAREKTFLFSTKVNFRPPFYTCQSCTVEEISETFNKKGGKWYDDDYISQNGQKQNNADNNEEENDEDAANYDDDQAAANQGNNNGYYQDDGYVDDTYMSANDDIYRYNNNNNQYYNNGGNRALLRTDEEEPRFFTPASGQLEVRSITKGRSCCSATVFCLLLLFVLTPRLHHHHHL